MLLLSFQYFDVFYFFRRKKKERDRERKKIKKRMMVVDMDTSMMIHHPHYQTPVFFLPFPSRFY